MEYISIGVLCSTISVLISYLTFNKNSKRDVQADTKERVEIKVQLEYISRGIDDVKMGNKMRDEQIKGLNDRVISIESEMRNLVSRVDKLDAE